MPRTLPTPEPIRQYALRAVRDWGPRAAARRLGIGRSAVISVAAGLPVMAGTLALVREAMTRDKTVPERALREAEWE